MAPRFPSSDELYNHLLGFVNVEKGQKTVFKLDRMHALCDRLGSPQDAFQTIHVAGSKGKGSVSAMTSRILEATGRRVGLYTSPHLLSWKERISLAGEELGEELILEAAEEVLRQVDGRPASAFPGDELPTYFELTTLIAFCAFRRAGCDSAVIETGLGGRLDSTNVVDSALSVITPIELEHTEWLGDTIALIAAEKAGIIKPGRPCYASRQRPEAREALASACERRGSPFREAPLLASISDVGISPKGTHASISFAPELAARFPGAIKAATPLIGSIQAENMALAILAAAELEPSLGGDAATRGLARAFLPARFQVLDRDPPIVLDGAHTPDSVGLALGSFRTLFPGPAALLFACADDKNHASMAEVLAPCFERITLTRPGTFKRTDLRAMAASFEEAGAAFWLCEDHIEAIGRARDEAAALGLPLLVTGSFYLCSDFARMEASRPQR